MPRWSALATAVAIVVAAGCTTTPSIPLSTSSASPIATPSASPSPPFRIVGRIDLGNALPWQLAADEASIWVLVRQDPTAAILRVDPLTNALAGALIPVPMKGWDLEALDGALWVGGFLGADQGDPVMRLDPATGKVTRIGGDRDFLGPYMAGGFGSIWTADSDERLTAFTVTRVDAATARIRASIPVGRSPQAIAVGEGYVWSANHDEGTLSRIDPATNEVTATIPLVDRPGGLTGSAHGMVAGGGYAFAMMTHEQVVLPIELHIDQASTPISLGVGMAPLDAVVLDGLLWTGSSVYGENEDRRVALLDVATLTPLGTGDVGARCCFGMAAGSGSVWVATRSPNQLLRLELAAP
jgi:YVTN family beta-propeller protein